MRKINGLILILGLICNLPLIAQTPINVIESTLKVRGLGKEEFYYRFAEGDQVIFNFEEINGKPLKKVEIIELPASMKFMDYKSCRIANKIVPIPKTGTYKFRFSNSSISGRICKFKIQRIPANESTKDFNTNVSLKTVYDTTYTTEQEKYVLKADTSFQNFYSSSLQISSQNALNGNANYQIVDFTLPENTVSWSFYLGTGKKGKEEYDKAVADFTPKAIVSLAKIPEYGPLAALALTGVSYFSKAQGDDNVKYWFLANFKDVASFQNKQKFTEYKRGDVLNEASQMKYPLKGKVYLALLNDNTIDQIVVTIKATAVIVKKTWGSHLVRKQHVSSHQEPYSWK